MHKPKSDDIAARKAALDLLNRLEHGHNLLDTVIERFDRCQDSLSSEDRRLANAIVFGVLRWRRRLDWIIRRYATVPPDKMTPSIRNILRIALFQIFFLDRVPDFAAVNTAVEMAKTSVSLKSSRFVNALLRNTLRKLQSDFREILPDNPVAALAISQSFPDRLIQRWIGRFGLHETNRLCEAMNQIPPVTIRTNTLKTNRNTLQETLGGMCGKVFLTDYVPEGLSVYGLSKPIDQLPSFNNGHFQVQDEAAQAVSHLLSPKKNEIILDACAGVGGKTGHIAQLMGNTGQIFAIDRDRDKLKRLSADMDRLGISSVNVRQINIDEMHGQGLPERFDRVLIDAPCSGLGVIRRNPDIKWAKSKTNLDRFAAHQLFCLDAVSQWVCPSGLLVYAVCTMEPEETDGVIEKFLKTHSNFAMVTHTEGLSGNLKNIIDDQGFFRSLPHIHHMDGFFAARLERRS